MKTFHACFLSLLLGLWVFACYGQEAEKPSTIPAAVQWTINAAGPIQRAAIKSVFLLSCSKTNMKGTGFLLSNGLIVTNNHVVEGCTKEEMVANPWSTAEKFGFTKMATDPDRDLALLHPAKHLTGGLELAPSDEDPALETGVETWGFPLSDNGPAPLLSVGYVAGYVKDGPDGKEVKHVVVNGAFNPGNSGGPLLRNKDNKVIGVVVAKFLIYPAFVKNLITVLINQKSGVIFSGTDDRGNPVSASEAEIVGSVLQQFYNTSQVMIGEAISVSELRAFLRDKKAEVE
jgi:S1-C subfamily serine protease